MLCIPLPLFIRMKLPLKKKIILCLVFSLGAFVVSLNPYSVPYNPNPRRSFVLFFPNTTRFICLTGSIGCIGTSEKSARPSSSPMFRTVGSLFEESLTSALSYRVKQALRGLAAVQIPTIVMVSSRTRVMLRPPVIAIRIILNGTR